MSSDFFDAILYKFKKAIHISMNKFIVSIQKSPNANLNFKERYFLINTNNI